jgi:hypothetical protein
VKFEILLDFSGVLRIGKRVRFLSWCIDESAIGLAAFSALLVSFNYPQIVKNNG